MPSKIWTHIGGEQCRRRATNYILLCVLIIAPHNYALRITTSDDINYDIMKRKSVDGRSAETSDRSVVSNQRTAAGSH